MKKFRKAFTLIELLVVIAIIGILAALLFPAVQGALLKTKGTKTGSDGRQIWLGLFDENTSRVSVGDREVWPTNGQYTAAEGSTEFFRDCLVSNWLEGFSAAQFSAPGIQAFKGTDFTNNFSKSHNAWSVTLDVDENTLPEVPFLFTRNIRKSGGGNGTLQQISELDEDTKPFGGKLGVVVTAGGRVRQIRGKDVNSQDKMQRAFNPLSADNDYLEP